MLGNLGLWVVGALDTVLATQASAPVQRTSPIVAYTRIMMLPRQDLLRCAEDAIASSQNCLINQAKQLPCSPMP